MCPDFPYIIQLSTPANGKVVKGQGDGSCVRISTT